MVIAPPEIETIAETGSQESLGVAAVPQAMPATPRLTVIDNLRGIASLAVAWFHFTNGHPGFLPEGWLKASGSWGWLGVEMFFVISGFVIPYSLHRGRYALRNFFRFLAKRICRLDPPYLAAIVIAVGLAYLSVYAPAFQGAPPHYTFSQLALHLGYLNSIANKPWVNPVFWSLGVEFQYYLLIGLIFPLLANRRTVLRFVCLAALLMAPIINANHALLFVHLPFFVLGIAVFQRQSGLLTGRWFAAILAAASVLAWFRAGPQACLLALATAAAIAWVRIDNRLLSALGLISYSLYLLHVPIGGRIVNLGSRLSPTLLSRSLVIAAALAVSLICSYLLYLLVERPAQLLSARINYRRASVARTVRETVVAGASA